MADPGLEQARDKLDAVYRAESGRILATLIRLLGDLDTAEDAMHDAFAAALTPLPGGAWQGPLATLGDWHLVFVEAARRGAPPTFEAARPAVAEAWKRGRLEAERRQAYAAALARHAVVLPPAMAGDQP